ncbi:TetR/AcrR family transcriptional regulator [Sulfitobacter sp. F26204]|uniref:TetR/AcrR family transcriptional regulator n=1 Tax=Sulfitobacter sp. F26204 TaxID=2996014 RepID=UPI00225E4302|nr:TetR/AcrR family transcriptional regulator [Sulfitobacter sp. F26204]MCX7561267.1 TetR/AcrR family transcriptional regulator [Sulfitobacter sp. F26204]
MIQDQSEETRPRGRPPSKAARKRALSTAHDILMEEGFGSLSIEAVATKSGVGKPTIYRNWGNACELAMAALMMAEPQEPTERGGSLKSDLTAQMRTLVKAFATTRGRQITMTLAAADPESEMTKAFRNQVILSSRETGRGMIEQAINRGDITRPDDIEVVLDVIYGPVFYRLLVGHRPLDQAFADHLVFAVLRILECVTDDRTISHW